MEQYRPWAFVVSSAVLLLIALITTGVLLAALIGDSDGALVFSALGTILAAIVGVALGLGLSKISRSEN